MTRRAHGASPPPTRTRFPKKPHFRRGESNEDFDDPRQAGGNGFIRQGNRRAAVLAAQADELLNRIDLTPRTSVETTTVAVWDLPAVMTLFIIILCLDCLIRKRRGMV